MLIDSSRDCSEHECVKTDVVLFRVSLDGIDVNILAGYDAASFARRVQVAADYGVSLRLGNISLSFKFSQSLADLL